MYRILVAGAGYVGMAIAKAYQEKKQKVFAITRSKKKAEKIKELEIEPVCLDLLNFDPENKVIPAAQFIVISLAPDSRDEESYYDTYVRAVGNLLAGVRHNPRPYLIVYISSTGVWENESLDWVDEKTPLNPTSKRAKILLRAEEQVLNSGLPSVVLRLSGIYGPGRHRLQKFRESQISLKAGKYMNMIHLEDIVGAMAAIFKEAKEGEVYIGTDDYPVRADEFSDWVGTQLSLKESLTLKEASEYPGKRLKNEKLKELGLDLKYPSYKEGYREIIESGE